MATGRDGIKKSSGADAFRAWNSREEPALNAPAVPLPDAMQEELVELMAEAVSAVHTKSRGKR